MLASIKHKGLREDYARITRVLREFYENGSSRKIQAKHSARLRLMLAALESSQTVDDMDIPGYRLHPLKGKMKGRWSISVSGNWRLTFEFKDGHVHLLDYEDYH